MRPPLCTDADDLLRCSATVGNLGERGESDILTYVRHWDLLRALRTGQSTRDLHFKHESELHMSASDRKRTRTACVPGEHSTIKPPMLSSFHAFFFYFSHSCFLFHPLLLSLTPTLLFLTLSHTRTFV